MSDPVIRTARLLLREPRLEDFEAYAELHADEDAARWIGGTLPRAAAWRKFLQQPGAWKVQGFGMFSVIDPATGDWLGQLGPWRPDGWPGNEIGYAFHPRAWGNGYATEAAVAAIDWAFAHLGWDDIVHCIHPDNLPSKRVAARLGSTVLRTGALLPAPNETVDVELWGQTRAQWQANRTRFA